MLVKYIGSRSLYAGILGILLFLAAGCNSCKKETAPKEREPLSLIPNDAVLVASVDVNAVRRSPAYKKLIKRGNPITSLLGECEYDPLPDIDRVSLGLGKDAARTGRGSIVVFGPIKKEKLLTCYSAVLRKQGLRLTEEEKEGITIYAAGSGRPHLSWLDETTLLLGDRDHVEKMISIEKNQAPSIRKNIPLTKLYDRIAPGRHVTIAALPDEGTRRQLKRYAPRGWAAAADARQVGLGIRLQKGMNVLAIMRLTSDIEGEKLAAALKNSLNRWQKSNYIVLTGLASHLRSIKIENAGLEITASANWNDKQVNSLVRLAVDSVDELMRSSSGDMARDLENRLRQTTSSLKQADGGMKTP